MTMNVKTIEQIVEENRPCSKGTVMELLRKEEGLSHTEAEMAVDLYCEGRARGTVDKVIETDGGVTATNGQQTTDTTASGTADIAALDIDSGEPTGEYFDGKSVRTADDFDGEPWGLPVLEDIGHPLVPEFDKEYLPRPVEGNRMDVEVVVRALANPNYCVGLVGETGVGKNALLAYVFNETNWPFLRKNMGVGMTYEKLVGMHAPTDDGHFEFKPGSLLQAAKNGWGFGADELNAAPPEVTMPLHGVAEEKDQRKLVVDEISKVVKPHDRFKMCATWNPTDYAGTNAMNRAFLNRFIVVNIPYLEADAEKRMLKEATDIDQLPNCDSILDDLLALTNHLRGMKAGGSGDGGTLTTSVSSRTLIKICNMIVGGDGEVFIAPKDATRFVLKGVAGPADWQPISTTIDRFVG